MRIVQLGQGAMFFLIDFTLNPVPATFHARFALCFVLFLQAKIAATRIA
jgi:hypothetical protein